MSILQYPLLFSPSSIGIAQVKNRIAMAPMGTHLQTDKGFVTDELIAYLEARAQGGVGLLITPFAAVVSGQPTLGAYTDEQLKGLEQLSAQIQQHGTLAFLQISHLGAANICDPVASTSLASRFYTVIPRELAIQEIKALHERFADAALRAKKAGFSGVELHGGYAYLVASFYSSYLNRRTDQYGRREGRIRFLQELVTAIHAKVGDFPLGFKMNVHEHVSGGIDTDEAVEIAQRMESFGVDYIHAVTSQAMDDPCEYAAVPSAYDQSAEQPMLAKDIKAAVSIPVIAAGGVDDPGEAERLLSEGTADMIAVGRGLIADPDWVNQVKIGTPYRPCIKCNVCHIREVLEGKQVGCSVNPLAGNELRRPMTPVESPRQVVVIGGGPAGIEAALTAAARGHSVRLFEKDSQLGGVMRLAGIPSFKHDLAAFTSFLVNRLHHSRVEVHLGTLVRDRELADMDCNVAIIATGSIPNIPFIRGLKRDRVITAVDVLAQPDVLKNAKRIVILGANRVGCELAWHIYNIQNIRSTLIDLRPYSDLLEEDHPLNRADLLKALRERGIPFLCQRTIVEAKEQELTFQTESGRESSVGFDILILAAGFKPNDALLSSQSSIPHLLPVGDCVKPRNIYHAIQEGFEAAYCIGAGGDTERTS